MSVAQPSLQRVDAEANLWLPPRRMMQYQIVKIGAALMALAIFTFWQLLRWHSLGMRLLTIALQLFTVWIVVRSVATDIRRVRGRQLAIDADVLHITQAGEEKHLPMATIAEAHWRDEGDDVLGLWLYDSRGELLAHLDGGFITDEDEARHFLRWARQRSTLEFPVRWPERD